MRTLIVDADATGGLNRRQLPRKRIHHGAVGAHAG
jgi:hypothetical protein